MNMYVGTDIIEIERIKKVYRRKIGFLHRIFTEQEILYLKSRKYNLQNIAGLFSAKESISKVLGTGIYGFSWKDIEILHDKNNAPYVNLYNNAKLIAEKKGIETIKISISHSANNVISFAIGYGGEE
ncbi:MAG: holo-ACP synthase [Thermoanaerobacteraceae bacterium]